MAEIKCPHCHKVFKVDEDGYAAILDQVRGEEFDRELKERLHRELEARAQLDEAKSKQAMAEKDTEIEKLRSQVDASEKQKQLDLKNALEQVRQDHNAQKERLRNELSLKDTEIAKLTEQLKAAEKSRETAVELAVKEKDSRISQLSAQLELKDKDKENALEKLTSENSVELEKLRSQLDKKDLEITIQVDKARQELEREKEEQKIEYEHQIRTRDEEIERIKDYRLRMSTKMVGESLERYCENEFNKIRMTAFPNAYFEKDNDSTSGSKGDYIFRENDENGTEIISIMFEMKNQVDTTEKKHKNEDFFKELDKDRREKNCEYAVLVSMLETENDFYNTGIVDVSYKFPKMYVIRPTFMIQIITILRNAALNSMKYKNELETLKRENLDITTFESKIEDFKKKFSYNYGIATKKFNEAIDEIDKSIKHLQAVKDALISSERQLRLASDKTEDLTIKKLTRNNPTMSEKFKALAKADTSDLPDTDDQPTDQT